MHKNNSFILLTKYDLLNDSYKWEKRESMKEYKWYWNNIERVLIKYRNIFNDEKCIFISFWYWFIFDIENMRMIESLMLKNIYFLIIYDSQIFHVNSFDYRNSTNVMQNVALRLISSRLFCIYQMMFYRIFVMRNNLIHFLFSL